MKRMKKVGLMSLLMMFSVMNSLMAGTPEKTESNESNSAKLHRVLVVSVKDNVKSNYFDVDILSEDSRIAADSICYIYNKVIEQNLVAAAKKDKSDFMFVNGQGMNGACLNLSKKMQIIGEEDKLASDLAMVKNEELKALLDQAGAAYLLVLDAHYLRYQELPFKTIFHYVNYSLYDAEKNRLAQGSNYFTSINPQTEHEMLKSSRKSSAKILSLVEDTLKN